MSTGDIDYMLVYEPLARDREIRLLELLPGDGNEPVLCRLQNAVLDEYAYEALSYTWEGRDIVSIQCNDVAINITWNLRDALLHLRNKSKKRRLWIDQICINQTDQHEKTVLQIPLMAENYSTARTVLVWLGVADANSDIVINVFPDMIKDLNDSMPGDDSQIKRWTNSDSPELRAINEFLHRSWFTRVWTLQEVAKEAMIICGRGQIRWGYFEYFNDRCQSDAIGRWTNVLRAINSATDKKTGEFGRPITAQLQSVSQLRSVIHSSSGYRDATQDVLHFHRVRSCGATVAKDKILALTHFLTPDLQACLRSLAHGLNHDTQQFYHDVAKFQLECNIMDVLGDAGLCQRSQECKDMPSWVPDRTTKEWTHNLFHLSRRSVQQSGTHLYQASGQRGGHVVVAEDGNLLHVKGKIIDDINSVGNRHRFTIPADHDTNLRASDLVEGMRMAIALCAERRRHIDECLSLAKTVCEAHYGPSFRLAFYHTMFRGVIQAGEGSTVGGPDRKVTDTELAAHFDAFFRNMEDLNHPQLQDALREQQQVLEEMKGPVSNERFSHLMQRATSLFEITKPIMEIQASQRVIAHVQDAFQGRLFLTTKKGYMGLGPCTKLATTKIGDRICILNGACAPFVIRPTTWDGYDCYELVGEAYVYGFMEGEALDTNGMSEEMIPIR